MRMRLPSAILGIALVLATIGSYLMAAQKVSAVGSAADAMCVCQMDPTKQTPPFCPTVPCMDVTSGFPTAGMCAAPGICKAQSTGGGGLGSMSSLMGMIGQLMQALGQGSGSGSGSGSGTAPTGCTTYTQTSNPNNADPCMYYVPGIDNSTSNLLNGGTGTTGGSTAANDLLSSLIGSSNSNSDSNSNTGTNSNNSSSTSTGSSNSSGSGSSAVSSVIASITNPQDLKPGTSASVSQSAFGNAPGITGDIQVLSGNRVTMLASNRDIAGNKQTSGFSGFTTTIGEDVPTVYTQACSARQWATNFLSTIIPATYFDNLCSSHGYSITPPALQPATPPPAPSPAPSSVPATSTPAYIGPMKADIWVSPTTVSVGSRASLFWSASGVLSCQISSPSGVLGSALSGNAAVGPLSNDTTYKIACQSATSSVANQVTIKVQ